MDLYSIKMRASKNESGNNIHVSGAEKIIDKEEIKTCSQMLISRAMNHENGTPDFINIKIEKIEDEILRLKALPITQVNVETAEEGYSEIKKQMENIGISKADKIIEKIKETNPMRGAMLLDINTLERLESDQNRGIRATYMDSDKSVFSADKNHFREAIILATKVANAPHIVGEICISDDINYQIGYFASKKTGYIRITKLKEIGDRFGGRIFLYNGKTKEDCEETINFIEKKPVIVYGIPERHDGNKFFQNEIKKLKENDLYRTQDLIEKVNGEFVEINNKKYLMLSSNFYLGLNQNKEIIKEGINAIKKYGSGTGGSRLICGNYSLHAQLENSISKFKGCEASILFNSGYCANLGVLSSIFSTSDVIFSDELNHASIIDGCRLSKARTIIYKHNDMADLDRKIRNVSFDKGVVVSDAVFSMDGDILKLDEFLEISKKYGLLSYVDEAHSTGVLGESGRGICEHYKTNVHPDFLMGTLSKAIGAEGGYIAGKKEIIDYLRNKTRSYVFSTSLSPAVISCAIKSFEILEQNLKLVQKLHSNIDYFNECLQKQNIKAHSETPIFSILIGNERRALEVAQKLFDDGYFVRAIRYPTVRIGHARLRITLTAIHTKKELKKFSEKLGEVIFQLTEKLK